MFWGISLEVGKRYSQTIEKSFHISMAALAAKNNGKGLVTVMVEVEKACYPICTLQPRKIPQQALDYVFTEGEEVLFYTEGDLDVHLTGYLIDEPSPFEYSSDEENCASASNSASSDDKKNEKKKRKRKRKRSDNDSGEEETLETLISELDGLNEDNSNMVDIWLQRSERNRSGNKSVEGDLNVPMTSHTSMLLDNGDSEGSEDDDWMPHGKRKLKRKRKEKAEVKKAKQHEKDEGKNSDSNNSPSKLNTSKSKAKNSKKKPSEVNIKKEELKSGSCDGSQDDEPNHEQEDTGNSGEEVLSRKELRGGLVVEDLVKGEGKKAMNGTKVSLYYKGCLQKTKKEFDSCLKGKPFTFRLGEGDVIKGWDEGVEGMQVGGKRRLTIPPSLGYGARQMGSSISPNSTLVFVVELLKVH